MSEPAKHTPIPWQYDSSTRVIYGAPDGDTEFPTVCDLLDTTEGLEGDCPETDRNGEFIVTACNAYAEMLARVAKPQQFKDYVHARLDTAGVAVDPESPHKAEGCRIGGRLDELIGERDRLRSEIAEVKNERDAVVRRMGDAYTREPESQELASGDSLLDRLRGIYTVPVNDGAGPLNGSMEFTRRFPTMPLSREAANEIVRLRDEAVRRASAMQQIVSGFRSHVADISSRIGAARRPEDIKDELEVLHASYNAWADKSAEAERDRLREGLMAFQKRLVALPWDVAEAYVKAATDPERWEQTDDEIKRGVIEHYLPGIDEVLAPVVAQVNAAVGGR